MKNYLITSSLGLEALVKKEVQKQWYTITKVQDKAVYFQGDISAIARMNLWSRFGNIVYYIVDTKDKVDDFDTYFDIISAQDWGKYIPEESEISIHVTSVKSELSSIPTLQSVAKKAIVKGLVWEGQLTENSEKGKIDIRILLQENELTIMLNTSGQWLHKRGYREMTGDAPLKENIAAALVMLSQWRFKNPLYDIFCGSGTIAIEAAMIARNIAPGLKREFAFETWNWIPKNLLQEEKDSAKSKEFSGEYKIYCSDIRKDVIELAKRNAHFAGVGDTIKFIAQDYQSYLRREISGTLVSNPPYGLRLEWVDTEQIHRDIAELFSKNLELWGGIITAHSDFESYSDIKYKRRKLYNGGEMCYFYKKEVN